MGSIGKRRAGGRRRGGDCTWQPGRFERRGGMWGSRSGRVQLLGERHVALQVTRLFCESFFFLGCNNKRLFSGRRSSKHISLDCT